MSTPAQPVFDPDAFMASRQGASGPAFDPDAFMASRGAAVPPQSATPSQPSDTGVWAGIKRNTIGMINGLYHALADPATDQEKQEMLAEIRARNAQGANIPEDLATNPSRSTLAYRRLIDAPADQLAAKGTDEQAAARDLLAQGRTWKGANLYASGTLDRGLAAIPMFGPWLNSVAQRFESGDVSGAATDVAAAITAKNVEPIMRGVKKFVSSSQVLQQAAETGTAERGAVNVPLTSVLTSQEADTVPPTSRNMSALQVTPREVLQHAADEGIDLTPAQATGRPVAQNIQTIGESAILTGNKIARAINENRAAFDSAVQDLQERVDPLRTGVSPEVAGEQLQNSAEEARASVKDSVDAAYNRVKQAQANLTGDVRTPLQTLVQQLRGNEFQTPAAESALKDIEGMLENKALQGDASIQSMRNLRTALLEKGNDYGANALADSGQRIYKMGAGVVDEAMMEAAAGTQFEDLFRNASSQNAKLQNLYNTRGSSIYRILNTDDPAKVTNSILSRSSATEIETLQNEGFNLDPLKRQAVQDIAANGFKVSSSGLGGYPDSFLRELLGPEVTKELYLKAQIHNALYATANPSGTAKALSTLGQLSHPVYAGAAQIARSRSMPRPATDFLPTTPLGRLRSIGGVSQVPVPLQEPR